MALLYRLISPLLFLLALPLLIANRKLRKGWRQRLGFFGKRPASTGAPRIWLHGASAGDLLALQPVIDALRSQRPEAHLVLSSMTESGQEMAQACMQGFDELIYVPWDVPFAVRGALRAIRPDVLVMEYTELWPNLIHMAADRGVRLVLTNGRLSASKMRAYRRIMALVGNPIKRFDRLLMRSRDEAKRAISLGASSFAVRITGNTKYDNLTDPSEAAVLALRQALTIDASRRLWVCGSTHEGEEAILLDVFKAVRGRHPELDMLIAPRYVERRERVAELARAAGLEVGLRSRNQAAEVMILDTIGELKAAYSLADVVFIGGSFITRGGQNILEPAAVGKPVLFGPHMDNFIDEVALLVGRGGLQVRNAVALRDTLDQLLFREEACAEVGALAKATVAARRGAGRRCAEAILSLTEAAA